MSHATETLLKKRALYPFGFVTEVASDSLPKGLSEETVRLISRKREEPDFLLQFRLDAYRIWKTLPEPTWANIDYPPIDYQNMSYYSAPKQSTKESPSCLDPEIHTTFARLGIPMNEKKETPPIAVDLVFDSVSLGVTFQSELKKAGVILCSFTEAVHRYPELIKKYLGSVVPARDNYFAALNAAVFTDGSFVYVPRGVRCPIELSTYFRINDRETGQFERTLILAEEGSYVSYLEGCTAPEYSSNQLHAAVVELVAQERAEIRYATVQNWFSGDKETGKGGIYNFVTKRGRCAAHAKISWTQVEIGAAITWKYPSCILEGDYSSGEFYSIALTTGKMQADTGTKMIHIGKGTRSTIISKGIAADESRNSYRGKVLIAAGAEGARNYTQCDSMLVGKNCSAHTFPDIEVLNKTGQVEHEASTSKMNEEQLFYLQTRGLDREEAITLIVNGFGKTVLQKLPLEFAAEAEELLSLQLENSVG